MARRLGDPTSLALALIRRQFTGAVEPAGDASAGSPRATSCTTWPSGSATASSSCAPTSTGCATGSSSATSPAVDADLAAFERLASELRQPTHLWHIPMLHGDAGADRRALRRRRTALPRRRSPRGRRAQEPVSGSSARSRTRSGCGCVVRPLTSPSSRDWSRGSPTWPSASRRSPPGAARSPPPTPSSARRARRGRVRDAGRGRFRGPAPRRAVDDRRSACWPRRRRLLGDVPRAAAPLRPARARTTGSAWSPAARPPPTARSRGYLGLLPR